MAEARFDLRPVVLKAAVSLALLFLAKPSCVFAQEAKDTSQTETTSCPAEPVMKQFQGYFDRKPQHSPMRRQAVTHLNYIDSLAINETKKVRVYRHDAFVNNIFLAPIDVFAAATIDQNEKTRYYALVVFNYGCTLLDVYEIEMLQ